MRDVAKDQPFSETAFFFPVGDDSLAGVITTPSGMPRQPAVVVVPGGWYNTSSGRNWILVRLCRRLAQDGHTALRFDYHGVGDSTGSLKPLHLEEPLLDDLRGAVDCLESRGLRDYVIVGWCFGARTALAGAPEVSGLRGLVLISVPPRDDPEPGRGGRDLSLANFVRGGMRPWVLRGLFNSVQRRYYFNSARKWWRRTVKRGRGRLRPNMSDDLRWVSRKFLDPLREIVRARAPILFIYGVADLAYEDFNRALSGELGAILQEAGPRAEVVTLPGSVHGMDSLELQDKVLEAVRSWMGRTFGSSVEEERYRSSRPATSDFTATP